MIAVRTQFTAEDASGRGDLAPLRGRSSAPSRCRREVQQVRLQRETAGRIEALEQRDGADSAERSRRTGGCSWAPSARATTSSRSAWTRRTGSGCSCTPGSRGVGNKLAQRHIKIAQELASEVVDRAARP